MNAIPSSRINSLASLCASGKVVLYAGYGMSFSSGFPDWSVTLKLLIDELWPETSDGAARRERRGALEALEYRNWEPLSDTIRYQLPEASIRRILARQYTGARFYDDQPEWRALRTIPFSAVATQIGRAHV